MGIVDGNFGEKLHVGTRVLLERRTYAEDGLVIEKVQAVILKIDRAFVLTVRLSDRREVHAMPQDVLEIY